MKLRVNGKVVEADVTPDTPLLWVLRDYLDLTGTKYGCGKALCGACTVHVGGEAVRSCVYPAGSVGDADIVTIEGLGPATGHARGEHPLQVAWRRIDVPQCGYCQPGQIMSAAALLAENPRPDDRAIDAAMSGNLCRCGTYSRIRAAIKDAAGNAGAAS